MTDSNSSLDCLLETIDGRCAITHDQTGSSVACLSSVDYAIMLGFYDENVILN